MQHEIGDHALLADGRTAALVDPDGNVAWLCWPRVDSPPCLLSLLDDARGGAFTVRPAAPSAQLVWRHYFPSTLVLRSVWRDGDAQLIVDDALSWDEPQALLRRVTAHGPGVPVEVRFRPAFDAARAASDIEASGTRVLISGAGLQLRLDAPCAWSVDGDAISGRAVVEADAPMTVSLSDAHATPPPAHALDDTLSAWRTMVDHVQRAPLSELVASLPPPSGWVIEALRTSLALLLGLLQRDGGIVAAPTTSLPQWPASSRTWDYRYCWLRDASLAGVALWRAGQPHAAHRLAAFLGDAMVTHGLVPLFRVDGGDPPPETTLAHLSGYGGARPVRVGNAAAQQLQIDAPAEFLELVWTLAAHEALPAPARRAATLCAEWLVQHAEDMDHGIWEIRGRPRAYTHSRAMASAALRGAADLSERGVITGEADAWRRASAALRGRVLGASPPVLQLHAEGGGADAALAMIGHIGFLRQDDPLLRDTLRYIDERLNRDGLLDRYEGQPDDIDDPCAPFVFPTFWMADALQASGGDGARHFAAALGCRGALDLFGEVADPRTHRPLGNYPQVQSHAAFINAALR